jgi:DNA-binding CsgD family transcriptional regulator
VAGNVTKLSLCYPLRMTERGRVFLRALTDSERRTLVMVCAGFSNGRIAERIGTSEQVIKNQMTIILEKACRRSRAELIVFAFGSGTVECPCKHRSPAPSVRCDASLDPLVVSQGHRVPATSRAPV